MAHPTPHGKFDHSILLYPFDLRISIDIVALEWEAEIESYHPRLFPDTVFCYRVHNQFGQVMIDEPISLDPQRVNKENVNLLHQFLSSSFVEAAKLSCVGKDDIGLSIVFMNTHAAITVYYQDEAYDATVPHYLDPEYDERVAACDVVVHILGNLDFDSMREIAMRMSGQAGAVSH